MSFVVDLENNFTAPCYISMCLDCFLHLQSKCFMVDARVCGNKRLSMQGNENSWKIMKKQFRS